MSLKERRAQLVDNIGKVQAEQERLVVLLHRITGAIQLIDELLKEEANVAPPVEPVDFPTT